MVLTEVSPIKMNNTFKNKNSNSLKSEKLDWNLIQIEMKNKLGLDIYESWLKKINFVEFKLPFKALPLCDNDFVQPEKTSAGEHYVSRGSGRTVTFRNGAPSIHAKGISCYSITEEKFFAYIYGLRYAAATPLRKFDVLNPYAKYCGDGGKWYYYDYGIGINRSDSYKSGICLEFENEKK